MRGEKKHKLVPRFALTIPKTPDTSVGLGRAPRISEKLFSISKNFFSIMRDACIRFENDVMFCNLLCMFSLIPHPHFKKVSATCTQPHDKTQ